MLLSAQLLPLRYDHTDKIEAISYCEKSQILVTGSSDGSLIIRNDEDFSLISRLQVGFLPIQKICINPIMPTVALLQSDRIDSFIVSVWNHETGEQLFRYRLQEKPLFVNFSVSGNYLIYSNLSPNSLSIIDAKTGEKKPWLAELASIIQAQLMSPNDKILATYVSSGNIIFFDVLSGNTIKDIKTLPNLENPFFISEGNVSLLIGTIQNKIFVLNGQSGKEINSTEVEGVLRVAVNTPNLGHLALYCYQDEYSLIYDWNFLRKDSLPVNIATNTDFSDSSAFCYFNDKIVCGMDSGEIISYKLDEGRESYKTQKILPFTGFSMDEELITLVTEDDFYQFPIAELVSTFSDSLSSSNFKHFPNPIKEKIAILQHNEKEYLAYNTEGENGFLYLWIPETGEYQSINEFDSPIKELKRTDSGYLGLTEFGTSFLISPETLKPLFSYLSAGTKDNSTISESRIITGRTKDSLFNTSLIIVDSQTGENVPLESTDIITFDISYNDPLLTLYTIGVENRSGRIRTVLKAYRGKELSNVRTLLAIPGEDHKATLLHDPYTNNLYTSLGKAGISILQWGGFTTSQYTGHVPIKMAVNKDYIFSINQDGTLTAWHKKNSKEAFTLYPFEEGLVNIKADKVLPNAQNWEKYLTSPLK